MSELRVETLTMPGAEVGPENPFPALAGPVDVHASLDVSPEIPAEDQKYVGFGNVPGCLPYRVQDGYRRDKRPRPFRVVVLENDHLRATFLLELGGRLHSLVHKPSGRERLEANPVFQPANLAIRNAWFSGGVEWNIGLVGHCPFTCSPVFAARVEGPGLLGTPLVTSCRTKRYSFIAAPNEPGLTPKSGKGARQRPQIPSAIECAMDSVVLP